MKKMNKAEFKLVTNGINKKVPPDAMERVRL